MSGELSLHVGAAHTETTEEALRHMALTVEEFGEAQGWPPDLSFKVQLIIEEVGLNAMTYGGSADVAIYIASEDEAITIDISDDGSPFDPLTEAPEANLEDALDVRPVGGLGLHLVKTLMDELSYRREGGRNHLTLVARRGG